MIPWSCNIIGPLQFFIHLELERLLWLIPSPAWWCIMLASLELIRIQWLLHQLSRVLEGDGVLLLTLNGWPAHAQYNFRHYKFAMVEPIDDSCNHRLDAVSMVTASRSLHGPLNPWKLPVVMILFICNTIDDYLVFDILLYLFQHSKVIPYLHIWHFVISPGQFKYMWSISLSYSSKYIGFCIFSPFKYIG